MGQGKVQFSATGSMNFRLVSAEQEEAEGAPKPAVLTQHLAIQHRAPQGPGHCMHQRAAVTKPPSKERQTRLGLQDISHLALILHG